MRRTTSVFLILVLSGFAFAQNQNQVTETKHVDFGTLDGLILKVRNQKSLLSPRITSVLDKIQRNLASLHVEYHKLSKANIHLTDEYVESLDAQAKVLENIVENKPEEQTVYTTLSYVNEDLRLKTYYIRRSPTKKITQTGYYPRRLYQYNGYTVMVVLVPYSYTAIIKKPVTVTVYTKRGDREVTGYEVWFVEKGLMDFPAYHKRFDSLSRATRLLAPGAYFVWTKKENNQTGPKPMDIGGQGANQNYEISLPN